MSLSNGAQMRCKTAIFLSSQIKASECQNDILPSARSRENRELLTILFLKRHSSVLRKPFGLVLCELLRDTGRFLFSKPLYFENCIAVVDECMYKRPKEWLSTSFFWLSLHRYSTNIVDHSYIITFFTTCFIFPLGLIFFCYGKLLRKLRKVSPHLTHMDSNFWPLHKVCFQISHKCITIILFSFQKDKTSTSAAETSRKNGRNQIELCVEGRVIITEGLCSS